MLLLQENGIQARNKNRTGTKMSQSYFFMIQLNLLLEIDLEAKFLKKFEEI
jgi:hypothetical protein